MGIPEAAKLSESIRRNAEGFKKLCEGLDEETASRATGDRWSPKQIISHVSGPEGVGFTPTITAILEQDTPLLELDPGNPFFSEKRARMTVAELLAEFVREYDRIAELVEGLSVEQLKRKGRIPALRDSPLGEYPTLADWILAIGDRHLGMHIDHMREVLQELEAPQGHD